MTSRLRQGRKVFGVGYSHRVFACLLAGLLGLLPVLLFAASTADPSRKLKNIKSEISTLERGITVKKKKRSDSQLQLERTERDIRELEQQLKTTETRIAERQGEIQRLERRAADLRVSFEKHYLALARHTQANLAMGKPGYFKILLNQEDVANIDRNLAYLDYINKARLASIEKVRNDLSELGELQARIVVERDKLKHLRTEQSAQEERLTEAKKRYGKMIAGLDSQISSQSKRLDDLKANASKLQDLISRLQRESEEVKRRRPPPPDKSYSTPPLAKGGSLPWPVSGKLLARFGEQRELGNLKWQGVLIGADGGAEVRAISAGQVVFADWLRGYGQLIIVDHGGGLMSLYGYNRTLDRGVGTWVKQGDAIARVGNSGGAEQTALYLEVRKNGRPLDPFNWLQLKN